ncbi:uncharacterized protein LOC115885704 [Sitophilus oryzae]|uniref:Uncharacterized protein LOC115885704 n=1 Tax=Sitophilus oryzae TaxID=7048 RepID=A0A6J2YBH0_SITOR|nr:uncharacterized protein LOC115885704 [Sitophilus oryzae]
MSIMISTKYLLLSCMWTFLSTNATKIPLSWTQNLEKERSAIRTPKWIDQIHSPSSHWYSDDILAQSEVIIPEHLKGESGFYLLSPNRQDQLSYSTIINQDTSIPVSDQQSLKKTRQNNELKHQRRIDFPKNKYLSKNQGNGDASVSSKYFYKPKPKKYQTLPDEVLKVKPLPAQNFKQIFKAEETPKSIQSVLNRSNKRKPSVYREYALSAIPSPSSNQYEPQNSGYYLTAPESEATELPISLTTQKEPILFVTQGYRNVLLQGANKPKKYLGDFQNKQESKKYEIGQVPVKRKLIKRPKVFIDNNNQENYEHFNAPSIKQAHVNQHSGPVLNRPSLTENYRDDRLHEPGEDIDSERDDDESDKIADDEKNEENVDAKEPDDENSDYVSENQGEPEELPDEKTDEEHENEPREPDNEHAEPKPVPTKPIYPGQGAWARKNVKHRPHISQHKFINPEANEQRPDGYDIFADLEQFFDSQRNSFERNLGRGNVNAFNIVKSEIKPPKEVTPLVVYDPFQEYGHQNNGPEQPSNRVSIQQAPGQTFFQPYVHHDPHNRNQETLNHGHISQPNNQVEEFVPQRLYTQVRNSENEKHLPYEPARTGTGRLKELIKDSKVHTVYSEEGYEDSAYDHAGHVKKAEQDEGLAKKLKYKSEKSKPKKDKEKVKDNEEGQSKKVLETENLEKQLEDSVPADSAYLPIDNQENASEDYEPPQFVNTKANMNKNNNFINTQELKTTHVKDKSNGDVQLEIESEVKVIMQPNNSTKAHKYVKIYPKILKDISRQQNNTANITSLIGKEIEQKSISSKYNDNTNNTNSGKSEQFIADVGDIHKSSKPSYIPENVEINPLEKKYGEDIFSEDISKLKSIKTKIQRKKRSPEIWFEDVNVDTKFIDKIEHKFEPKKKEKKLDTKKYPYYKRSDLNQDSPLRYAENINNVPVKQDGELSFYKTADRHECPDIPQNIDPVPDHVRNAKEEEEDYDDENEDNGDNETDNEFVTPKGPRITELGDKIDCLKTRYFGTNPLDNPIFKEKNVGPVQSIFEELDKTVRTLKNMPTVPKETFVDKEINNEVDERPSENEPTVSPDTSIEATVEHIKGNSSGISNIQEAASIITNTKVDNPSTSRKNAILPSPFKIHKAATEAVVSLITTPRYTIKLTPNNIYDQIKLLDHLPTEQTTSSASKKSSDLENSKKKSVHKTTTIAPDGDRINKNYGTQESFPKNKQIGHETRKGRILKYTEPVTKLERNGAEKDLVLKAEKSLKTKGFSSDNIRRESKSEAKDKVNTTPNNQNKRVPKLPQIEPKRAFIVKVIEPEIENNEEHKSQKERPKISNEPDQITDKSSDGTSVINEPQALRYRKRKPMYQIFDINKFLTTTPYPLIDMRPSTVLPKYKVISEVFYKEEIKPNEQLNVFADVLNNIKNSSNFESLPIYAASDFSETDYAPASQNTYKHKHIPIVRVKKYEDDTSNYNNKNIEDLEELNRATKFSKTHVNKQNEQQPTYKRRKEFNTENNDNSNTIRNIETKPSGIVNSSRRKHKIERRPSTTTSTTTKNYIEDNEQVIGLVPPENWQYKTIIGGTEDSETETTKKVKIYKEISRKPESNQDPAPVTEIIEEPPLSQTVNKYYVIGLKPPLKIKPKPYYQYLDNKKLRRRVSNIAHQRLRNKREAARPTYSDYLRNIIT